MAETKSQRPLIDHVSDTALWVAVARASEGERKDALYHDPLALVLAGERGRNLATSMPRFKMTAWAMTVRTVAIDRLIRQALDEGIDTVVNLGTGLDTRPYRMELPADLRWIEVDFPDTIALKNEQLKNERPHCRLERMALDLSNRELAREFYRQVATSSKKVLVLTEGVILYLSPEEADALAHDLHELPQFRFWIQDHYTVRHMTRFHQGSRGGLKEGLIRFLVPDWLTFFTERGWKIREQVLTVYEGSRIGRPFPAPFPWNALIWLMRFAPKKRQEEVAKDMGGYVFFERD